MSLQVNSIISLIKANSLDEAKSLLDKTQKQNEFKNNKKFEDVFMALRVFFMIRDKKESEALQIIDSSTAYGVLLKCQIHLNLK